MASVTLFRFKFVVVSFRRNFVHLLTTSSHSSFTALVIIHLNCMNGVGLHKVTIFNALKWKQVELFASVTTITSKDLMFLFRIQLPDWLCFYNIGLSRLYGSWHTWYMDGSKKKLCCCICQKNYDCIIFIITLILCSCNHYLLHCLCSH